VLDTGQVVRTSGFIALVDVVAFKQRFYSRGWARYDQAKPGTFRLMPSGPALATVQKDYAQMRNMIYGRYPAFDEIMAVLQHLEDKINALGVMTV
jgi:hypothetical protein